MKKHLAVSLVLVIFAACSNPALKWIETSQMLSMVDKAITSFSFGIRDEAVTIKGGPDASGRTPIKVILPKNTGLYNLKPSITFIGTSLVPPSGEARDFIAPVVYTVFAEDGSHREYVVEVLVKNGQSAEIVWFDLEIPGAGDHILAEGVVNDPPDGGSPGEVIVHVPSGTDLTNLTAHIAQTGESLRTPAAREYRDTVITLRADFSTPGIYTVTAEDKTAKEYLVTVIKDKDNSKEITAFSFAGLEKNETVIIGAVPQPDGKIPIVVTVPLSEELGALTPRITYTGAWIEGEGISVAAPNAVSSPGPKTAEAPNPQSFTFPVTYRVTAEDGSIREYEVTVYQGDLNTGKQITGFYFILPNSPATGAAGIINETAKTIAVTVPAGTDLRSLSPVIYHTGVSVSPISGEPKNFSNSVSNPLSYTVKARDGSSQTYRVSVYVAASGDKGITGFDFTDLSGGTATIGSVPGPDGRIPIVVTVPPGADISSLTPQITHTGTSVTGGGIPAGGSGTVTASSPVDFNSPVSYTIKAEDGSEQSYTVTVIKATDPNAGSDAAITGFYFNNPLVVGVINQNGKTITATVPYDADWTALIPTIYYTGESIRQGMAPEQRTHPAAIGADFSKSSTAPVPYTVKAQNGTEITYGVTVSLAPKPKSPDREITAFNFNEVPAADTTTVIASVPDASGQFPIDVTVPLSTSLTNLSPVITHTGVSITGAGISGTGGAGKVSGSSASFSSPVRYTVRAENGETRNYLVSVRGEDNNAKKITGFYFTGPVAAGVIDEYGKTITVTVPNGTKLDSLTPTIYYTGASLNPAPGRATDFSSPVIYTVTARNGTVQPYTVRVSPKASSAKEITAFSFPGVGVLDTVIGAVPDADGHIPIAITVSERTNMSALTPLITHTGKTISPDPGSVRDFRNPVIFRVTAEDGSTKDYAVSVHISGGTTKVITGLAFKSVPVKPASIGPQTLVSATGQIDQTVHTIKVSVPHSADISSLAPTITYIGSGIRYQSGTVSTANPFTDTERNFTVPQVYIVTAADGETLEYTVTIEKRSELTVKFEGITDPGIIQTNFDQTAGLLTITIIDTRYTPFEWYLDGKLYPVSATERSLVLKTGDLAIGQHEVVPVAAGPDGKHYTNKVYFSVQE